LRKSFLEYIEKYKFENEYLKKRVGVLCDKLIFLQNFIKENNLELEKDKLKNRNQPDL
jgi:hypothetical protein